MGVEVSECSDSPDESDERANERASGTGLTPDRRRGCGNVAANWRASRHSLIS